MENKELKTLKDIEALDNNGYDISHAVSRYELKQEAIKWVKQFKEMSDDCIGIALNDAKAGEVIELTNHINEKVFKMFFNITSEDLEGSDKIKYDWSKVTTSDKIKEEDKVEFCEHGRTLAIPCKECKGSDKIKYDWSKVNCTITTKCGEVKDE